MTQQPLSHVSRFSPPKGQHHLLLLGYLLPLSLLSGGVVTAQAAPESPVQEHKKMNQEEPAFSLAPIEASTENQEKSALPDYESASPIHIKEPEMKTALASPTPQPEANVEAHPELQWQQQPKPESTSGAVNAPSSSGTDVAEEATASESELAYLEAAQSSQNPQATVQVEPRQPNPQNSNSSPTPQSAAESESLVWQKVEKNNNNDLLAANMESPTEESHLSTPQSKPAATQEAVNVPSSSGTDVAEEATASESELAYLEAAQSSQNPQATVQVEPRQPNPQNSNSSPTPQSAAESESLVWQKVEKNNNNDLLAANMGSPTEESHLSTPQPEVDTAAIDCTSGSGDGVLPSSTCNALGRTDKAIAQSSSTSSSTIETLPNLEKEQPSSAVEPIPSSQGNTQHSDRPEYQSATPLQLNHQSPSEAKSTQLTSQAQPESEPKQELQPIQPLVNSSSNPASEVPEEATIPQANPSAPESVAEPSQLSQPTHNLESRESNSASNNTVSNSQSESGVPRWQKVGAATNDYVDFNSYPQASENSLPAPRIEVSDRAKNCTTIIEGGQLVSGSCNVSQDQSASQQAAVDIEKLPALPQNFQQPTPNQPQETISTYTPPEDLPELKLPDNGDSELIFPLAQATAISSNYGWRVHPVHGDRRFHTGTDFIAPEGTPVVATKSGRVVLADYTDGYGLIVGLRHNGKNESRYAHLSQIHVKPGQWVEQGTVIGRVGNTGLSTGPHLHFEWRVREGSRWIAVNAGKQLLIARANLDPSQMNFDNLAGSGKGMNSGNFLAYIPGMLKSLPSATASWMALPELPFLKKGNFKEAYERQAPLSRFAQRNQSVFVLPFSLPKALASLLNLDPPQLFAKENLQQVPKANQVNFQDSIAYRSPSPEDQPSIENYVQASQLLSDPESLESLTNLEALGTLNFPDPRPGESQQLSHQKNNEMK